jgi:hypothetical protein
MCLTLSSQVPSYFIIQPTVVTWGSCCHHWIGCCICKCWFLIEIVGTVGGHKMHIFTANIPTFHSRYRRYALITNELHELCWSTILGTSDDEKASYGPKSKHIFNMSKIRHSNKEYDTRGWCGTKAGPNREKLGWPAPPPSLADQLSAPFQIPLCQRVKEGRCMEYPMPKVGAAMKLGRPTNLAGRPDKWAPLSPTSAKALT